jgi:hypothetical protein
MTDRARRHRVICADREVPAGWVVIGFYHNPACEGRGPNAYVIKRPGKRETVCADSPIPEGYVKVREAEITDDSGGAAWVIERKRG